MPVASFAMGSLWRHFSSSIHQQHEACRTLSSLRALSWKLPRNVQNGRSTHPAATTPTNTCALMFFNVESCTMPCSGPLQDSGPARLAFFARVWSGRWPCYTTTAAAAAVAAAATAASHTLCRPSMSLQAGLQEQP
eukprot:TRINITY_DN4521_c0_g1_i3.p2 TRINITY_DN4521_c0_g1~~TRINITY_DN4521_c0_g1_i3.p2  ORF type:complete len:136 (+),score=10.58 TRINITY_DN4521_c0_g1_i3:617-1024(+)